MRREGKEGRGEGTEEIIGEETGTERGAEKEEEEEASREEEEEDTLRSSSNTKRSGEV